MKMYYSFDDVVKKCVVEKFNPYHDELGRFTSKNGGKASIAGKKKEQKKLKELEASFASIHPVESGEEYVKIINAAKASRDAEDRWRVTPDDHDEKEYGQWKTFTTEDGSCGCVKPDGDIVAVCRKSGDKVRGSEMLAKLVQEGGTKLDSYSGNHKFYTRNGFEPVSWCEFNEEFAPDDWRHGIDKAEPIIFYKYSGKTNGIGLRAFLSTVPPCKDVGKRSGYDIACEMRDASMKAK